MLRRFTTQEYIDAIKLVHQDKYDYSKVEYVDAHAKVTVICKDHGEFYPKSSDFRKGSGCRRCKDLVRNEKNKIPFENFLEQARATHGDLYKYSQNDYKAFQSKTSILCSIHGTFYQTPHNHIIKKSRCPKCVRRLYSKEDFIKEATAVHQDKYNYSKINYKQLIDKVEISCKEHGAFWQLAFSHLNGSGCRKCADKNNEITLNEFLEKAEEVHENKYDYSEIVYKGLKEKIYIKCPKHGAFLQYPGGHVHMGSGCPRCAVTFSKPHEKIVDHIKSIGLVEGSDFTINDRGVIKSDGNNQELDVYFADKRLAIEINGKFWHSTNKEKELNYYKKRHLDKLKLCREVGIQLIQFNEDEISSKFSIVSSILSAALNLSTNKYAARKLQIRDDVNKEEVRNFLNDNHIQGCAPTSINIGLYAGEELIQLMTFGKSRYNKKYTYELIRLCTKTNASVAGGSKRIFKCFVTKYLKENESIVSYCDLRLFKGEIYRKLGFNLVGESLPNYTYLDKNCNIIGGRLSFQKHKLKDKLLIFDATKTEYQNMFANGCRILFDCGNSVWQYTKSESIT